MADRTIPNPERGCGTLKRGKAYVRGVIGSPDGILPSFVRCDPFVPYREMGTDGGFTRGFLEFDGVSAQFALEDDPGATPSSPGITTFRRLYPGDADDQQAVENMVDRGLYPSTESVPPNEAQRHVDRIAHRGTEGEDHFGAVDAVRQSDLLMRAGKTHYPEPDDFIDEAVELGISKAIPLSKRQDPPVIQPGVTRIWIVHPETPQDWAVIGYAYLQEVVFTEPADGNVPQYVQEHASAGRLDIVDIEPAPDDQANGTLNDFTGDDADGQDPSGGDETPDEPADSDATPGGDGGEVVIEAPAGSDQDVAAVDDLSYNDLKAVASRYDLDVGPHPSADDLRDAIKNHAQNELTEI